MDVVYNILIIIDISLRSNNGGVWLRRPLRLGIVYTKSYGGGCYGFYRRVVRWPFFLKQTILAPSGEKPRGPASGLCPLIVYTYI